MSSWQSKQRAAGLCAHCGKIPSGARYRCESCRIRANAVLREYRQRECYKDYHRKFVAAGRKAAIDKKYESNNLRKKRAHRAVHSALRKGKITKMSCEKCGGDAQAHHDDYGKPLEVRWLCPIHHAEDHVAVRNSFNR